MKEFAAFLVPYFLRDMVYFKKIVMKEAKRSIIELTINDPDQCISF